LDEWPLHVKRKITGAWRKAFASFYTDPEAKSSSKVKIVRQVLPRRVACGSAKRYQSTLLQ
jgi:hypothetical protein